MENNQTYAATPLKTDRGLAKFILLSLITLGIYGIYVTYTIGRDVNTIASRYDNKKTMNFWLVTLVFSWLTFGIVPLVWYHNLSNRIGNELKRRNLPMDFNAGTFWLWSVLGSIIIVGPFIYLHKLLSAMNTLSENYNTCG